MSLMSALDKAEQAVKEMEAHRRKVKPVPKAAKELPEGIRRAAAEEAAAALEPRVRNMVVSNYRRARINRSEGQPDDGVHLEDAVRKMRLVLSWGSTVKLRIVLPSGYPEHFYVRANSLHYGAVRTPMVTRPVPDLPTGTVARDPRTGLQRHERRSLVGARAKRSLKKIALSQRVSNRARRAARKGRTFRRGAIKGLKIAGVDTQIKKVGSKSVHLGGAVVIRPRPYFYLSSGQKTQIRQAFGRFVRTKLKAASGGDEYR